MKHRLWKDPHVPWHMGVTKSLNLNLDSGPLCKSVAIYKTAVVCVWCVFVKQQDPKRKMPLPLLCGDRETGTVGMCTVGC